MNQKYMTRLTEIINESNCDACLVVPSEELVFLIGHAPHLCERFQGLFVKADGSYFYVATALGREEMSNLLGAENVYSWHDNDGYMSCVKTALSDHDLFGKKVLVSNQSRAVNILEIMEACDINFVSGRSQLEEVRIIKTPEELVNLRKAASIADGVFEEIIKYIKPGMTEGDIAEEIMAIGARLGSGKSFSPIVASGPNSSMPHYTGYDRVIQEQDIIIMDYGFMVGGMCSDITRTVFVGSITEKQKHIYNLVKKSNETAEASLKLGQQAREVDASGRKIIDDAGYGEYLLNRIGHGIGYSVHEAPYMTGNNKRNLENGMCFTIEPGIYLPGEFGVRIEDIAFFENDKPVIIENCTHDIVII